jgi:hypothetical protein
MDPDGAPAMRGGPHAAAHTADHRGRGLDLELPLAADHLRGENLDGVQAEQPGDRGTTVLTHLGPPLAGRQTSASYARPQGPLESYGAISGTSPRFMTKSH